MVADNHPAVNHPAVNNPAVTEESIAAIRGMLAGLRRRTRGWIWAESLATAIAVAVAGGWLTLVLDRLIEPPAWVRVTLLVAIGAAVAWVLVTRLVMRLAVPLTDESLALVVERTHPEFGDGLSTAVSCGLGGAGADIDPEMLGTTVAAAAARASTIRSGAIFRRGRLAGVVATAAAAIAVTAAAAVARPAETAIWARRMFGLSDAAWPRRVTLEPEGFAAGRRVVARGDDVDVVVRAIAAWGDAPNVIELRTRTAVGMRSERMGARGGTTAAGQSFGHVLKGVDQDLEVEVRGGDARLRGLRIVVEDPPAVAALAIAYTPPSYLGDGPRTAAASRIVTVPRGSTVSLTCTSSKPLSAAAISIRTAAATAAAESVEQPIARLDDAAAGTMTISARTPPIDADTAVLVRLVDDEGLVSRDPVAVVLAAVPDEPPRVAVRLAGISSAVTPQVTLPIEGEITDDHALAAAEVRLAAGGATLVVPIASVVDGVAALELPADRPELVRLDQAGLAIGTRLEVSVSARDRCTFADGPNETTGETWMLDVVSPESLRALLEAREVLLRRRLEGVIDDLTKAREGAAVDGPPPAAAEDAADGSEGGGAVRRCGEAAARAAGETAEIAGEFRGIHRELLNNAVATPELEARLLGQIAEPLAAVVAEDLSVAIRLCRQVGDIDAGGRRAVATAIDAAVARLRAVLARMLELESINEVIDRLRGVIRAQEQIRDDTLERQRRRGREALESP